MIDTSVGMAKRIGSKGDEGVISASNIFDPMHFAGVRRPIAQATHLPPWSYTSEQFFARERERVLRKTWNFVGRADRIANPGDYFTVEIGGAPLVVIRDRKNELRAVANTCRHRGARLLNGEGQCAGPIVCPYHSWSYSLDGHLIGTPGMKGLEGFNPADYPLVQARLEIWEGFVFVSLDPECESLANYLGELPDKLRSYNFADMICTRRKTYDVACNWKLLIENSMEDYHTATVHHGSIGAQTLEMERGNGNWEAGYYRTEKSIATLPGETAALPWIESLDAKAAGGTYFVLIYPHTTLACNQDGMFWLELYPRGPARTEIIIGHAFPRSTVERPDFATLVEKYYHRADLSIPEDNRISEQQQRGLDSPLARPGRVSLHEPAVHTLANWLLDRILPPAAPAPDSTG